MQKAYIILLVGRVACHSHFSFICKEITQLVKTLDHIPIARSLSRSQHIESFPTFHHHSLVTAKKQKQHQSHM
jgi:hypothetical protein